MNYNRKRTVYQNTANISAVKITVFRRVPFPAVIPLYYLHLITALVNTDLQWFTIKSTLLRGNIYGKYL